MNLGSARIHTVSGVILAGGTSSRLGRNKALIKAGGRPIIERVARKLRSIFAQVVLVTNTPEQFGFLDLTTVGDIHSGIGTLGGLHAGLSAIQTEYGLIVGCDMPFLNVNLLRYLISLLDKADENHSYDVIMPRINKYNEPLHAIYAKRCLPSIEQSIRAGQKRILQACARVHVHYVGETQIAQHDPHHLSFFNVNTPEDLQRMYEILVSSKDESP